MATLVAALVLSSISLNVEQSGGLSLTQVGLAVNEMQQIWRDCGVAVTPRGPRALRAMGEAVVSLRVVGFTVPRNTRGEPILAWVAVDPSGAPAPVVSLPPAPNSSTSAPKARPLSCCRACSVPNSTDIGVPTCQDIQRDAEIRSRAPRVTQTRGVATRRIAE